MSQHHSRAAMLLSLSNVNEQQSRDMLGGLALQQRQGGWHMHCAFSSLPAWLAGLPTNGAVDPAAAAAPTGQGPGHPRSLGAKAGESQLSAQISNVSRAPTGSLHINTRLRMGFE